MVKIRLKRMGRKHRPFYRVIAINSRDRREGASLCELGYYNPVTKELKLNKSKILEMVALGAQMSDRVKWLMSKAPETGELAKIEINKGQKPSKKALEKEKAKKEA